MGVSGSGKSTLAKALAARCEFLYLDADDYHSEDARDFMARGVALTDELREPWIASICSHLQQLAEEKQSCVLAFSGLKKSYRDALRNTNFEVTFLFLQGNKALIRQRMDRPDHFMSPTLLDSQFDTLEIPAHETDVIPLDTALPLPDVIERALSSITNTGMENG